MQRRNNNRHKARKGNQVSTTMRAQNGAGVSGRDMVRSVRKFMIFTSHPIENSNSEYAYGLKNFNISGAGTPLSDLLDDYGRMYEQYRIRRAIVRCTPGRGYTNDMRLKTYITSRVDVDKQPLTTNITSLKSLINAENSVTKTMIERGNLKLCDFKPQCRVNTTASMPMLPNALQFYPTDDHATHVWKGATVAVFLPEPSLQTGVTITLSCEIDLEFRGRVSSPALFVSDHLNQETPVPTPDILVDLATFRNNILTGVWFPMGGFENVNVANIGHTVSADQIVGAKIRVQSDMKIYDLYAFSQTEDYASFLEVV